MNSTILASPDYIDLTDKSLIFLAGPIQGTYNWQKIASDYFIKKTSDIIIASPRNKIKFTGKSGSQMYNEHVDWKAYHLGYAGKFGVIMFWLAKELESNSERDYSQNTLFDLGELKILHEKDNVKIALGIEEGFSGMGYISRRFNQDCPDIKIFSSLEETCDQAINLLK